jgi:hypothetical protein
MSTRRVGIAARVRAVSFSLLLAAALGGCTSARIQGKVVVGDVSFMAIVESDDSRLEAEGIEGVTLYMTGGDEQEVSATGYSGPTGEFDVGLPWRPGALGPVDVLAEKDGYLRAKGTAAGIAGKRLLVILKRRPGAGPAPGDRDPEADAPR